jgi:ADP-ribosylation factor-like protein 6
MEIHYINISKLGKPCLVYDLSGNGRHRDNWKVFFAEVQAILYVVDASDSEDRFNDHFAMLDSNFRSC